MNLKKMLEIAGVDAHLSEEKKEFAAAEEALDKLCAFLKKQSGADYEKMCKEVMDLKEKMAAHLKRYEK
jgi:hypothetical protein